jgi:hypothetical protein
MHWTALGLASKIAGSGLALLFMLLTASRAPAAEEPTETTSDQDAEPADEEEEAEASAEEDSESDASEGDRTAEADESEAEADDDSDASAEKTGSYQHDGLYLRLALGVSYFSDAVESEPWAVYFNGVAKGTLVGTGWAGHVAAGYTVVRGLVLGGAFVIHYIPSVEADNAVISPTPFGDIHPSVTFESATLSLIGPFVDYYPNSGSGLHLLACAGYGILSLNKGVAMVPSSTENLGDQAGTGFAVMIGAGFDIWIGKELSLGIVAEVMGGVGSGDDASGTNWDHLVFTPAVLIDATYN